MENHREMSPAAHRWCRNAIVAFRNACDKKGGYVTAAWEKEKFDACVCWAGKRAEKEGVLFGRWMVEKVHKIIIFKQMNAGGLATKVACSLAEFYRGRRPPASAKSSQFRKAANITWEQVSVETLADQFPIHLEYAIACQVVFDLMIKKLAEPSHPPVVNPPVLSAAGQVSLEGRVFTGPRTHADLTHEEYELAEGVRDGFLGVTQSSGRSDVVPEEVQKLPRQLEFRW